MTFTFRSIPGGGPPRFTVLAGARVLGTISNPGPRDPVGSWHGLAPDGSRFTAGSKPKIAERLALHVRSKEVARDHR